MAFTSAMSSVRNDSRPLPHGRWRTRVTATNGVIGFPDPFAVATINGEQTQTTAVSKRTLCPYWNESFDLCASPSADLAPAKHTPADALLAA